MLRSPWQVKTGTSFPIKGYEHRNAEIARWRELWGGDFTRLGKDTVGIHSPNWFKRVVTVYTDFLFGQRPQIVDGLSSVEIEEVNASSLWDAVALACVDLLRYGRCVVARDVMHMGGFAWKVWQPDFHYEVWDNWDRTVNDVLLEVTGPYDEQVATVLYLTGATSLARRYKYEAHTLGAEVRFHKFRSPQGRRGVAVADFGYPGRLIGESLLDGIEEDVYEVARVLDRMGTTLRKNMRPHMYGPDSIVLKDASGNAEISTDGEFFPLGPNDVRPRVLDVGLAFGYGAYLSRRASHEHLCAHGSLSASLRPVACVGRHHGTALKRYLLPFYAKTEQIKAVLSGLVKDMVV